MKTNIKSEALEDLGKAVGAKKSKKSVALISDELKSSIDKNTL